MLESLDYPKIVTFEQLKEWMDKVASGEWSWVRNTRCKYVTFYIDTRSGGYLFKDRDSNPVSFEELCWQYSKETPEPPRVTR